MNKYKKFFLILIILLIIVTTFNLVQTYSKYLTSTQGTTAIPISRWNIKINNASVQNNSNISATLTPTFPGNANIASGIIAPTAEGYFDLAFDFTNVDVSFSYTITMAANTSSAVSDIVATGYSIDGGTIINFTNFNESLTDTILFNDVNRTQTIRIFIKWNDDTNTTNMNNIDDTASTYAINNSALFDVHIALSQII